MLRRLRKNDWGKTTKVILLSNLSSPEREDEARELRVNGYIIKAEWKLENVVSKVLEQLAK